MLQILIAEDEPRLAAFLEKGLAANGYLTTTVHDGDAALRVAGEGDFELLLLDIGLPGVDGVRVLRQLRDRGDRRPVILTSAREEPPGHGASAFLAKPFALQELLALVRKHSCGTVGVHDSAPSPCRSSAGP